ncbi:MAG: class I SAM-dependent methyltransferase [Pseudomonadota bacterium]
MIEDLLARDDKFDSIFDPFMGSGTVLSESLARGVDFYGTDVNPLSLLCCKVKSDYFNNEEALSYLFTLRTDLKSKGELNERYEFNGAKKWFDDNILAVLTSISKSVQLIPAIWCKRIFWLALSETVRKFSRTRASTYKLHVDKNHDVSSDEAVFSFFFSTCERNIRLKNESWCSLDKKGFLKNGLPVSKVHLELSDVRCLKKTFRADLVVTSPPYGDNQTTVTYGQFSYLPLQFIDVSDLDCRFDQSLIETQSAIDSASLGGSLKFWHDKMVDVEQKSESLFSVFKELRVVGRGGEKRLASFCYDLHQSLISISQRLNDGGYSMVTLGNRRINGISIPLDEIVSEFLSSLGFDLVAVLNRKIMKKRMAGSMSSEKILIMRKTG